MVLKAYNEIGMICISQVAILPCQKHGQSLTGGKNEKRKKERKFQGSQTRGKKEALFGST